MEDEEAVSEISSLSGDATPKHSFSENHLRPFRAPITVADREGEEEGAWLKDILIPQPNDILKPSISAKIDGLRYLCLVKHDGSCELIASAYAPHELSNDQAANTLMVLDGELVSLGGGNPWEKQQEHSQAEGGSCDSRFGNIYVIFDVLTKEGSRASRAPVAERLKALERLLWNGDCKLCGIDSMKSCPKPVNVQNKSIQDNDSKPVLATTTHCSMPKCSQCNYGLKLYHPWFIRAIVKRSIPLESARLEAFKVCCLPEIRSQGLLSSKNTVKTTLYDGCIIQVPSTLHDTSLQQQAQAQSSIEDLANFDVVVNGGIGESCYKIKGTSQLTVDLCIQAFLNVEEWSKDYDKVQLIAEAWDEERTQSYCVIFPLLHPMQLESHLSVTGFGNHLSFLQSTNGFHKYYVECLLDIPETTYSVAKKFHLNYCVKEEERNELVTITSSRWIFQKFRRDKSKANTKQVIEKILKLSISNTVNKALVNYLALQQHAVLRSTKMPGLLQFTEDPERTTDLYYRNKLQGHFQFASPSVLTMKDLLWNKDDDDVSNSNMLLYDLLKEEDRVQALHLQRVEYAMSELRSIDISIYDQHKDQKLYLQFDRLCFRYHHAITTWLYGLFESGIVIDLIGAGSNRLKYSNYWESCFQRVIGIGKKSQLSNAEEALALAGRKYDHNKLTLLPIDAKKSDNHEFASFKVSLQEQLGLLKADCCFAMFTLQNVMSSRSTVDFFLKALLPSMKSDSYLMALVLDGDALLASLHGDNRFMKVHDDRRIHIVFNGDDHSWCGTKVRIEIHDPDTNRWTSSTDNVATGLSNPMSNLNCAMSDCGFDIQTVLPFDALTHLLPTYEAVYYDGGSCFLHNFISFYKCVIWRRNGKSPSDESGGQATDETTFQTHKESNVTLMQHFYGQPESTTPFISEASWSLLIYDMLDIRSHFQLAMTNKQILRHYLRGSPSGVSLYSLRAIRSGLHIRHTIQTRENPLFLINHIELDDVRPRRQQQNYDEMEYDDGGGFGDETNEHVDEFQPSTPPEPLPERSYRFQSCSFRVLNPSTYYWLQGIPCVEGCSGCVCSLQGIQAVARDQLKVNLDAGKDYYSRPNRRPEPILTTEEQQALRNEGKYYYPFPVDKRAMFCMCHQCLIKAFKSSPRAGFKTRESRFFPPLLESALERSVIRQCHFTSHPPSMMTLLILRSLFTSKMNVNYHFPSHLEVYGSQHVLPEAITSNPLDKMFAELVPELFGFDDHAHCRFRTSPVLSYLTKVRQALDDNLIQVWMMYEYGLAVELMHRGPPFPTASVEKCIYTGFSYLRPQKGKRGHDIPYPEDVMLSVMDQTQYLIRSHATWNERWAALRFRANKRQHAYEYFCEFVEDDSEGEQLTDITPFQTAIW